MAARSVLHIHKQIQINGVVCFRFGRGFFAARGAAISHTKYLFINSFRMIIIIAEERLAMTKSMLPVVLWTHNKFILAHINSTSHF